METRPINYFSGLICLCLMMIQLPGCSTDSSSDSNSEVEFYIFTEGMGTEANPFHVTTVDQLQAIDDTLFLDKHFIQAGDIDASASYEYQSGSGWKQIGSRETPFTGSYNGNGYVIRDLKLHVQRGGPSNGVWGYVKNGRIENVFVDNSVQLSKVRSDDQYLFESEQFVEPLTPASAEIDLSNSNGTGGMVGFNDGGEIINSTFHGRVGAVMGSPAGFVGINTGLVENSHFKGTAGGFGGVGFSSINTGKIIDSSTEIRASGMGTAGFVGNNYGEIIRSYAHVDLSGSNIAAGFSYRNYGGRIESSYVTGKVSSSRDAAGFILHNSGEVINSYSNVDLNLSFGHNEEYWISGFVYENAEEGVIEHSYVTGSITVTDVEAETSSVFNINRGTVKSLFWDMESLGEETVVFEGSSEGIFGLTTEQMTGTAAQEFMPAFDWNAVWRTTASYPVLWWED